MSDSNGAVRLEDSIERMLSAGRLLLWILLPLMIAALYGMFIHAPTERVMGEVQRLFYFHMGSAVAAFAAFFLVFAAGSIYLWKGSMIWDRVALSSVECGILFTSIVLATGPVWARPVWNTWLPLGDPRVMTTLVLWLIFVAYLILRASLPEGEKKYRICAVYGIIGFLDVPIVFMSIRWWRTIHPVIISGEGLALEGGMKTALFLAVGSSLALLTVLVLLRASILLLGDVFFQLDNGFPGDCEK